MTKGEGQFVEWNGDRALAHAIRVFGATLTIEADAPWACLTSMAMTRAGLLAGQQVAKTTGPARLPRHHSKRIDLGSLR